MDDASASDNRKSFQAISAPAVATASSNDFPCVAVVIPVFNGERTIGATLASVRQQTWPNLEIVVVDDGSTDGTRRIVEQHRQIDKRLTLLAQRNRGVAAARNHGILATSAEYVATLDADDLWAPQKVALQVDQAVNGGDAVGLVYTWFARIDAAGLVVATDHRPRFERHVLRHMCRSNFIGTGSSVLMRRRVLEQVGGYDESLRARNAQGCEDLQLYLRIAEVSEFRVVPKHLTGYRRAPGAMSSDLLQMFRSGDLVLQDWLKRCPQYAEDLRLHRQDLLLWLLGRAVLAGQPYEAMSLAKAGGTGGDGAAFVRRGCCKTATMTGRVMRRAFLPKRHFADGHHFDLSPAGSKVPAGTGPAQS